MRPSDQHGFILMIVVMVLLILAAAGLALFRIHDQGVALPSNPLTNQSFYSKD